MATLPNLDQKEKRKTFILSFGGAFLQTGVGYKPQAGNRNVAVRSNTSPVYFLLLIGSEIGKNYAGKRSHEFIFYPDSKKRKAGADSRNGFSLTFSIFSFCRARKIAACWRRISRNRNLRFCVYLFRMTCFFMIQSYKATIGTCKLKDQRKIIEITRRI